MVLPEDPTIPLLGIYPEDVPNSKKDTCSTMFIAALFIYLFIYLLPSGWEMIFTNSTSNRGLIANNVQRTQKVGL